MKKLIFLSVPLVFFLSNQTLLAQEKTEEEREEFLIKIQIRPRAEVRAGAFTPLLTNQDPASFISQRSRMGLYYSKGKKLSTGINLQTVTVWGNEPQIQVSANSVSVFEAWAQLKAGKSSNLKLGRQVFPYDDERILGGLDWHQAARKHDALLYRYENNKLTTDFAFAYNQNSEKINNSFFNEDQSQPYKFMQFLWLKYKVSESVTFSSLFLNLTRQRSTDSLKSYLQTLGFNIYYKKNKLNTTSTFYYQTGKANFKNTAPQKTSAAMLAIYGSYALTKKTSLGFGSDYLSGMDWNTTSKKNKTFNPLYGTNHKFYGFMDYFYVGNPHRNTGLWDNYLSTTFKPSAKTSYQIALHHFVSPVNLVNYQSQKVSSYLGDELDITFNHEINKGIKLMGGYSQMFAGKSMRYVKNIPDNQNLKAFQSWLWLSINIIPEIKLKSN